MTASPQKEGYIMDGKVPVSERALFQRIQRKLNKRGQKIFRGRPGIQLNNLGTYYTIDLSENTLGDCHISDLEKYAREYGAIAKHEYLNNEGES
jgi:hypothetical protein